MQYTIFNIIQSDINTVITKFTDPEGIKHWMEGFIKMEAIAGTPGEVGAKTNMHFMHKGKQMTILEEILEQNLPNQIKFAYHSPMGFNTVEMRFEVQENGDVKQINTSYFKFKGIMKLFAPLMKGMFKKQSFKYLDAFKAYVETGASVHD